MISVEKFDYLATHGPSSTSPAPVEESAGEYTPAVSVRKSLASKDHLISMIDEAVVQYGVERVARGLKLNVDTTKLSRGGDILRHVTGAKTKEEASIVFSRFLSYLSYVEYPGSQEPMPEMSWFTVG